MPTDYPIPSDHDCVGVMLAIALVVHTECINAFVRDGATEGTALVCVSGGSGQHVAAIEIEIGYERAIIWRSNNDANCNECNAGHGYLTIGRRRRIQILCPNQLGTTSIIPASTPNIF